MDDQRIIGRYTGKKRGPLLIGFGGLHGNEKAGIKAWAEIFRLLEQEPRQNPDFAFSGRLLALRGNMQALASGKRFIEKDLNRQWKSDVIRRIKNTPLDALQHEDRELRALIGMIEQEIEDYAPEKMIVLDLHTTTASGGIFSIPTDHPESIRIGLNMHVPVIKGMLYGIEGSTLHYFNNDHFTTDTIGITFEAGQHDDPLSVNRSIAAIVNCMRTIGCVRPEDVENHHTELLEEYSRNLPRLAELVLCHRIKPGDGFRMQPGYLNFQPVRKGEILAYDKDGPIAAVADSHILMPLYQEQGDDGFFLVRSLAGY